MIRTKVLDVGALLKGFRIEVLCFRELLYTPVSETRVKLRPNKKSESRGDVVVEEGLADGSDQQLEERDQQLGSERHRIRLRCRRQQRC